MTFDALLKKHKLKPQIPSSLGKGWVPLVDDLIKKLKVLKWDGHLAQCKEKFGGLRFYVGNSTDQMQQLILEAERASFSICENCGKPGKEMDFSGWTLTLCKKCGEARRKEMKKRSEDSRGKA